MTLARASQPAGSAWRSAGASFASRSPERGMVIITVGGEIDACNADLLVGWVSGKLGQSRRLVVDCSSVTFFAVEGFAMLQRINVMCAQAGVSWVLVPSTAVSRVMRLCNPGGSLVPAESAAAATGRPRQLRLVRDN